jgi:hypothetical protein
MIDLMITVCEDMNLTEMAQNLVQLCDLMLAL